MSDQQEPENAGSPAPENAESVASESAGSPKPGSVDAKLGVNVFKLDQEPHIEIELGGLPRVRHLPDLL